MYAVIRTGGKQYRVAADDVIEVERLKGEPGDKLELDVLMMGGGDGEPQIGAPLVANAMVSAEVVEHKRGEKIIIFKKKRRQNYRRKNGHRQELTVIRVVDIFSNGEKMKRAEKKAPVEAKSAEAKAEGEGASKAKAKKADAGKAESKKAEPKKAKAEATE